MRIEVWEQVLEQVFEIWDDLLNVRVVIGHGMHEIVEGDVGDTELRYIEHQCCLKYTPKCWAHLDMHHEHSMPHLVVFDTGQVYMEAGGFVP